MSAKVFKTVNDLRLIEHDFDNYKKYTLELLRINSLGEDIWINASANYTGEELAYIISVFLKG